MNKVTYNTKGQVAYKQNFSVLGTSCDTFGPQENQNVDKVINTVMGNVNLSFNL